MISLTNNLNQSRKIKKQIFNLTKNLNELNNLSEMIFNVHRNSLNLMIYVNDSIETLFYQNNLAQSKKIFSGNLNIAASSIIGGSLKMDSLIYTGNSYLSNNIIYTQILKDHGVDSAKYFKTTVLRPLVDQFIFYSQQNSKSISAQINFLINKSSFSFWKFLLLLFSLIPIFIYFILLLCNYFSIKIDGLFIPDAYTNESIK